MAEKKEVAKVEKPTDFTELVVQKLQAKENFGLTYPQGYNATNELMGAMLILQETVDSNKKPVLQSCSKESIQNCLLEMATSGLSMQKKQCYPVAYGGKLQLQKSVFGNTCIARRYGLKSIDAQVIYDGDEFEYHIENAKKVIDKHKQDFKNIDNEKIVGAYAVATMTDGAEIVEIMNMAMIKQAWKQGFGYKENGNGTHQKFTDQMAMKTVKNRLLKQINNTYGTMEVDDLDAEDVPPYEDRVIADVENEIQQNANSEEFIPEDEVVEKVDGEIVDADFEEVTKDAPF